MTENIGLSPRPLGSGRTLTSAKVQNYICRTKYGLTSDLVAASLWHNFWKSLTPHPPKRAGGWGKMARSARFFYRLLTSLTHGYAPNCPTVHLTSPDSRAGGWDKNPRSGSKKNRPLGRSFLKRVTVIQRSLFIATDIEAFLIVGHHTLPHRSHKQSPAYH